MSRAIWRGAISFGLVSIRVRLHPATRHLDVRFRELDRTTGHPLRHQRVRQEPSAPEWTFEPSPSPRAPIREEQPASRPPAPPTPVSPHAPVSPATTVRAEDVVRGFEFERERYVTVSAAELESIAPERTRTIDIEQFVAAADVDPIYFDTTYYVVPEFENVRPFAVLLEGMRETGRLALSWIVLRKKRHLAALRERGQLMVLTTMFHADEVLPAGQLQVPLPADLSSRERDMARLLIETLSGPFEPERYRDEYRERLAALLEQRAASQRTPEPEPQRLAPATGIEDLMAALQASVERARQQQQDQKRPAATRAARRGRRGA
jgi:DNA end-binding protein Ku